MNINFPKNKIFLADLILQRTDGFIKCGGGSFLSNWMNGDNKEHLANYLIEKYKYNKIAIIDFDVHHGNGTQDIFYNNKKVLYISTHQYPYYPGTGSEKEKGKFDNIFNIPLHAGTTAEEYLNAYEHVLDKIREFKPEFLLFSAGFDAHIDDPLAQLKLESEDFYKITKRTLELSKSFCNGNVVSILEGGYDLKALQDSTQRHVDALIEFN